MTGQTGLVEWSGRIGQWMESVTDWAIRITEWRFFAAWTSNHARLADLMQPMPINGKSEYSGLPIALISRLPDWVAQSVLPIAIRRVLHRFYPSCVRSAQGCPGGGGR